LRLFRDDLPVSVDFHVLRAVTVCDRNLVLYATTFALDARLRRRPVHKLELTRKGVIHYSHRYPCCGENGGVVVRVSEDARKCVVFFGTKSPNGKIEHGGTGFLVVLPLRSDAYVPYLVTARHVAEELDVDFTIRANRADGEAEDIPIETIRWIYPEDKTIDLAVARWILPKKTYDQGHYLLSKKALPSHQPMCGTHIALVGLFRLRYGKTRNIPIVHSGHVAALADPAERIPVKDRFGNVVQSVAHLVEAQTLDGLSGAPVFVQEFLRLEWTDEADQPSEVIGFSGGKLFGVYQSSWDAKPGEILEDDRGFGDKKVRVPVGIGLATPVEELMRLLTEHPECKKNNEDTIARADASVAAAADSGFLDAPQADDDDTNQRERFTALLNAGAKKRP
jgi:hypothetical protein